jgi:predicted Zn-dependent protease
MQHTDARRDLTPNHDLDDLAGHRVSRSTSAASARCWAARSLSALALLSACGTSATGRHQLLLMPGDELRSMGEKAFVDVKTKSAPAQEATTNEYVKCVARSVLAAIGRTPADWEVVVFDDESANAFALPGGKIGVYSGLLKVANDQDQLAAVLGHEISHVTQQHSNERVSQAFVTEGGLEVASAALGSQGTKHDVAMAALGVGAQVGLLMPFSRTQESEADVVGLEYMARAGFNPEGALRLWKNMSAASADSLPEFLSTHPSHRSRIDDLQKRLPSALAQYQSARSHGSTPACMSRSEPVASSSADPHRD